VSGAERSVTLRAMTDADVPQVVAIQEPASIVGLASVFPQSGFPFPRDDVARRWLEEIGTPGIDCHVVVNGEAVVGFAAIRDEAHDAVIDRMRRRGVVRAWLRVFTGNGRGRAFYERLGLAFDRRTHAQHIRAQPGTPSL